MIADFKDHSEGTSEVNLISSSGKGYEPKIRKPYIITKQREKWTDEEHRKFVEALKLYGRAWRRIEEYVGTKTVIQIRSHSQKFFAKVSRDSGACGEGLNPEDIPPPRPKKKPLHPYPRKPSNNEALDNSHCASDGEKGSPVSVFSAVNSDNVESADALSSTRKLNLFPQETESTMESTLRARSCTSIKLFGKTVVVSDDAGQSSSDSGDDKGESSDDSSNNSFRYGLVPNATTAWPYQQGNSPYIAWYYTCLNPSTKRETPFEPRIRIRECEIDSKKGFLPYKRCLAERDELNILDEWEGQTARVCS